MPSLNRVKRSAGFPAALLIALLAVTAHCARASEGGGHNVAAGAITNGSAYVPLPGGNAFTGYFLWLGADSVRNNAGKSSVADFRLDYYAHAGRFEHTWDTSWKGLNFTSSFVYLLDYAKLKTAGSRDENVDLSAINFEPLIVTAAAGNWHFLAGSSIWYPIGEYDPDRAASAAVHAHYASFVNEFAVTWVPLPWVEVSLETDVTFNLRNRRTQYRSGDLLGTDLGITVRPFTGLPQLGIGIGGLYLHQFTDDHLSGAVVPAMRLTKIAVGPQAIYAFGPATAVVLKWQHETRTDNTARGELVWLEFALPLGSAHKGR
ncbi:MAG: transporter [Nevskia sp.]|nr:transporter [Nevskia sp.]